MRGGFFIVYNKIPALIAAVEANSRAAVKRKADDIHRDAKSRINRVTGELQDTSFTTSEEAGKSATIQFPAEHAGYVEHGTRHMSPRPYLQPAMDAHADDFFESVGKGVTL
jgi:HK97 gp10 family phage protein